MSSAVVHDLTTPAQAAASRRPRVLVLRSCRPAQFVAAVAGVRRRHSDAEIVALSHRGHRESLLAAGVDRVVELEGRRFGLLRTNPLVVRKLRQERFDEAVIPQMTAGPEGHGNLYRLVAAVRAARVTVLDGDSTDGLSATGGRFARYAIQGLWRDAFSWLERPIVLLALLAAGWAWPRSAVAASRPRRRVLHIISSLGVGGAQRQLAELVNRTPADRYDVDVLVLGACDGEFARQWFARPDVRVTYLTQWPRLVSSVLAVRRHCRAGDYDIVHTWLFMANVIGVAGACLARVPAVIASVRNLSLWKRKWYRQWWFRAADAICTHAADVVTVNADALKRDHGLWAWYDWTRIEVVHNGLEPSQFLVDAADARRRVRDAAGVTADTIIVGTVGRLAPEKDHHTFLRVIAGVRKVEPRVHGVIVGDGQLRSRLEALAKEMGLADHVSFLGERNDARRLMAGFDVFLLTSTIEGFPNVLLEAAFLAVPSVASHVGGAADVLPNPSDLFELGDIGGATRRVLALLGDRAMGAAGGELARQRAFARFTADQTAKRWFALYDRSTNRGDGQ
jgi:glycosyltransferase involved in cell wall biosynthesis